MSGDDVSTEKGVAMRVRTLLITLCVTLLTAALPIMGYSDDVIILNDATIIEQFGPTTPEERAVDAQRAEQLRLENERLNTERAVEMQKATETPAERTRQREEIERRAPEEKQRAEERSNVEQRRESVERGRR
jgi:membrane protein involved in colicin uptake